MAIRKDIARVMIVVFLSVLAFGVSAAPVYAGVSPEVGRYIGDSVNGTYAYIGETNLKFVDTSGTVIPAGYLMSDWEESNINVPFPNSGTVFDSNKEAYRLLSGWYKVTNLLGEEQARIYFASAENIYVVTRVRTVEDFGWVTRGVEISFEMVSNLDQIKGSLPNNITYKLLDPGDFQIFRINGLALDEIDVSDDGDDFITIDTTGLDLGIYTLSIVTDPETNNGLNAEGPEVSFEVRRKGISITADTGEGTADAPKETVTQDVTFGVETTPDTPVELSVTWGASSQVTFKNEQGEEVGSSLTGTSSLAPGKEGTFDRKAYFSASGSYEITATERLANTTDSIFVEIVPYEVKLDVDKDPPLYHIGENVEISCSADIAVQVGSLTLKINDETVASNEPVDGLEYTWNTESETPDSYVIELWVLPFSNPSTDPPDASLTVVLIRGGLFVESSTNFVVPGDKFTVRGIVPGRDTVEILMIAPDGGGGDGLDPDDISEDTNGDLVAPGLRYDTTSVTTGGEFETEDIKVKKDLDLGTYTILALNYGRDGEWGNSGESNLLKAISADYATPLGAKMTDQLMAIVKDKTIDAPGTDDLLGLTMLDVEPGFITLDTLEDVPLGAKIPVTGTTNRQLGTALTVTVEGTDERTPDLKPKIGTVTSNEKTYYNTFSIPVETTTAKLGEYLVTVDDNDGHTASTTLTILPAEEFPVNVSTARPPESEGAEANESAAETPPSTPTARPTMTPFTPPTMEPAVMPGFLSLWIVLMILWLVIAIMIAVWIYRDATDRGQNGALWVIITLILGVVGLLIWLIKRPKTKQREEEEQQEEEE